MNNDKRMLKLVQIYQDTLSREGLSKSDINDKSETFILHLMGIIRYAMENSESLQDFFASAVWPDKIVVQNELTGDMSITYFTPEAKAVIDALSLYNVSHGMPDYTDAYNALTQIESNPEAIRQVFENMPLS